jgi:hypothetical protein
MTKVPGFWAQLPQVTTQELKVCMRIEATQQSPKGSSESGIRPGRSSVRTDPAKASTSSPARQSVFGFMECIPGADGPRDFSVSIDPLGVKGNLSGAASSLRHRTCEKNLSVSRGLDRDTSPGRGDAGFFGSPLCASAVRKSVKEEI